jgi:amino acid transporter
MAAVMPETQTGLQKGTNWWGAFVIGLAGTILVTGIAPYAVQGMGATAIWAIGINTMFGLVLCLCLAELACMWPDRTGGIPSYTAASFEPLVGKATARHLGGLSGWSYWLGWFPVAPINMILTAAYLSSLFSIPQGGTIHLFGTYGAPVSTTVLLISFITLLVIYVPCYFGVKLGAGFATFLGVASMIPLTLLVLLPLFKTGSFHWSNIAGFHAPKGVDANFTFIIAWMFPITWSVIAMEAAACYVGECRNGPRDAKIAMTAEGIYGMLIYILTPLVFVGVLGAALTTADPLTLYTDFSSAIFGHGSWIKWFIGLPLILALLLSVLNAIMGTGRSLYQASEDGMLPRWFGKVNVHGVPARAMAFNVVASMIVVLFGSPVRIYIFSNAGYLFSCAMSLAGYFVYRQLRPEAARPLRLWSWVRFLALAIFLFWAVVYFYGGWNAPNIVVAPNSGPVLFILGLVIMAFYFPLYFWRKRSDLRDPAQRHPAPAVATAATAAPVLAEEES